MSDRDLLLVADVGTTMIKVSLWDVDLRCPLAMHRHEYGLEVTGERVECGPRTYLAALDEGVSALLTGPDRAQRVRALALTTQGETLLVVDHRNRPVGPAIVWLDARASAEADELRGLLDRAEFSRRTGVPRLDAQVPLAKARGLARAHRDVLDAGGGILLLEDYLVAELTGRRVTTASLQTSTGWFDLTRDGYWEAALEAAGVGRQHLPEIVPSGREIGPLRESWARRWGLARDVVLVSGAMDQTAAALGSGALDPGDATIGFGTALTLTATTDAVPAEGGRLTVYRHAVPGRYLVLDFLPTGGAVLTWLRRLLDSDGEGIDYTRLNELASAVPPGSDGVIALPSFGGDGGGGDVAPGAFIGLGLNTAAGHLARSVMEGTAFALREMIIAFEEYGIPARRLHTTGGGSRSAVWQQIVADVCQRELRRLDADEAASRGAALLAAWGSGALPYGAHPNAPTAAAVVPDPAQREVYTRARRRFRRAVEALSGFDDVDAPPSAPSTLEQR